ncbi:hypothetical protein C0J45_16038 [Silurus meridionalis]|nr:hypothetical protein C0J45_16038 [Silurus meridionalis]
MALERCMAFLLADEFDSEELVDRRVPLRARGTGGFDDDDDEDDDDEGSRNYFSATVPSLSVLDFQKCFQLSHPQVETDNATVGGESIEERANVQTPFHELQYGHSGSLGGISKRQDVAASLGRKNTKKKVNLKFSSLVLGDLNLFQQENSLFTKPAP